MGKNRTRESLIRELTNIVMHKLIAKYTNRPETVHFLESEIIEYRSKAEKTLEKYNWNADDKGYIEKKALKMIKEKLATKYPDVRYSEQDAISKLRETIKDIAGD